MKFKKMIFSMFFWVVKFDCLVTKTKKRKGVEITKDFVRKKTPKFVMF
jgi:hypothetical protein